MKNVRIRLLATTAILALSSTAYAADMAVKAAPPVAPVAPVVNWTGFYVGGQIGGASFDPSCATTSNAIEGVFSALPCTPQDAALLSTSSLSTDSVIGGGKVGYDWQWNRVVLGILGEFDWTDLNGTSRFQSFSDSFIIGGNGISTATANEKISWLASVRGRLGWAFDSFLVYGTGGVAWTRIKASASLSGTCCGNWTAPEVSTNKTGAVAGGGFEYRVTQNVSVVGELLWYGFGSLSTTGNVNGITYTTTFKSQDILAGTLGVNWRF